MKSKHMMTIFLASLVAFPVAFATAVAFGSDLRSNGPSARIVAMTLTISILVVEILALVQIVRARALFSKADAGRLAWTFIVSFLFVRILAEIRRASGLFGLVSTIEFNFFPLYLYTVSDLLFVAALITTIRLYKGTGLKFEIKAIDYLYIAGAWVIAALTVGLAYYQGGATDFASMTGYREVAVTVGGVIVSLGLVVRRYVSQMGGGAVARVWNAVVIASVARDASHLSALLAPFWFPRYGFFVDAYLCWIFACFWVLAATYQMEIIPRVAVLREEVSPA